MQVATVTLLPSERPAIFDYESSMFSYQRLNGGIHLLTLHVASPEAVRAGFMQIDAILATAPLDQPLLILCDLREAGMPPLVPLWHESRRLWTKYPQRPPVYAAVLHHLQGVPYLSLVAVVREIGQLFGSPIAFFEAHEVEPATNWLLAQVARSV
jgi:hypothetical protein